MNARYDDRDESPWVDLICRKCKTLYSAYSPNYEEATEPKCKQCREEEHDDCSDICGLGDA